MRILSDLTQKPMHGQPGVRGYVVRDMCDPMPGAMLTEAQSQVRDLALPGSIAPAPVRRPRPAIQPLDQSPHHPRFAIIERASDLALARVRGDARYVAREAAIIAREHGCSLAELRVVLDA